MKLLQKNGPSALACSVLFEVESSFCELLCSKILGGNGIDIPSKEDEHEMENERDAKCRSYSRLLGVTAASYLGGVGTQMESLLGTASNEKS
mmetsp:Transcript_815/g.1496  ORF Transcript_815/g.1496 Transcript_815/m.1496 type:complete len:92 (-) Transcript_815:354-629(-)